MDNDVESALNTPVMSPLQGPGGPSQHMNKGELIPELVKDHHTRNKVNKDERMAREAGITISVRDIVELPWEGFNDVLSKNALSEDQYSICRGIRKRGRNKIAAQNCRQRKLDQIKQLRETLEKEQDITSLLRRKHEGLVVERRNATEELNSLTDNILISRHLSPQHYKMQFTEDDNIRIVRRSTTRQWDTGVVKGRKVQ